MSAVAAAQGALSVCTIGDLLELDALSGAQIFPPDVDRSRPVRSVTIGEADGGTAPGSLVVMAGTPIVPPGGAAATISRRRPKGNEVPAIVLPPSASWATVLEAVHAAIATSGVAAHGSAARTALREPLLSGANMGGVAAVAQELLGGPVAILDEYLDLLGHSGLDDDGVARLRVAVDRARGHGPTHPLGPFLEDAAIGGHRRRVSDLRGPAGAIVLWIDGPLAAADRAVLNEVSEAVLVERVRESVRIETEAHLRGELIDELLAGEAAGRESVIRRGRLLGTDLADGAIAIAARLGDPHDQGREIREERIRRRLLQQLRGALDRDWPRALIDWHGGQIMGFLPLSTAPAETDEVSQDEQVVAFVDRLLALSRPSIPGLELTLAVSRVTPEPERLGVALDEASLALQIAVRLGRTNRVTTFEETGTYKLLFQIMAERPEDLTGFYDQTIAPLVRYDDQYNTDLVSTLATYLELDGNLAATASTLFTHRHTIRYRLDRIAEIGGLDVGRSDDREKLSLGLKAMRLLGRRVPTIGIPRAAKNAEGHTEPNK
jgi:sugar diacid utilization regulator